MASTFGMAEYEQLAANIIVFLASSQESAYVKKTGWEPGLGWKKQFSSEDVTHSPSLFAMFCAAGWLENTYFPKGGFVVSEEFIERVSALECRSCKGSRLKQDRCTGYPEYCWPKKEKPVQPSTAEPVKFPFPF